MKKRSRRTNSIIVYGKPIGRDGTVSDNSDRLPSRHGRALLYPLICLVAVNLTMLTLGMWALPRHSMAVRDAYERAIAGIDLWRLALFLGVSMGCLLVEAYLLGWRASALRKLLNPSRSAQHDIIIPIINRMGLIGLLFLFYTVGLVPVLSSDVRTAVGIEWARNIHNPVLYVLFWYLVQDFFQYWFHRLMHTFAFTWELHKYHHAATEFTMLTGNRQHILERILAYPIVTMPLIFLGMPPDALVFAHILGDIFNRFHHSMIDWNLGWVGRWLLVSPVAHRIHHSKLEEHWDKNFGAKLVIWDRLFGTYYNGPTINTDVGVSDNYFERESILRSLFTSCFFFVREFWLSLTSGQWTLAARRNSFLPMDPESNPPIARDQMHPITTESDV